MRFLPAACRAKGGEHYFWVCRCYNAAKWKPMKGDAGEDCFGQMTAEVREGREDSRGRIKVAWVQELRDKDYLDCELMIHTSAIITGLVRVAGAAAAEADKED